MARKARDYAAEYARRRASGARRGLSSREARGHKNEPAERKERRARTYQKHGVSPERLSRLNRQAVAHVESALGAGSKGPVNHATIVKGMRLLPAAVIEEVVLPASGDQLRGLASLSYQAMILEYPELENDDERNPFWYHA